MANIILNIPVYYQISISNLVDILRYVFLSERHHVSGKQDTEDQLFSIIAQSNCMDFKWNEEEKD